MIDTDYLTDLKAQFQNRVSFKEKRPGTFQLVAPYYHEDGDMYDVFIEEQERGTSLRITDKGLTLMRLSYSYQIDTPNKERIYRQILSEHGVQDDRGELRIETSPDSLLDAVSRFTQTITSVSNMALYRRDIVRNLFYEMFTEFVTEELSRFSPESDFLPLPEREELSVDFRFSTPHKPIFLFGVKDSAKSRLVTIACLEFLRQEIPYRSLVVHENFDTLPVKDRRIITNVVDKQFTDLDDFEKSASDYLSREIA